MMNKRAFRPAAILCGGALCGAVLLLSGCHPQETGTGGKAFPAPHAAPPVQAQIQAIESDPHIPAAQKAAIEARIANGSGIRTEQTPAKAP